MTTVPAIKGLIGDKLYYQCTMNAKDLIANLSNMGKVVDGLSRLEEIVKKEEQAANTNRGGIEVNKYSM